MNRIQELQQRFEPRQSETVCARSCARARVRARRAMGGRARARRVSAHIRTLSSETNQIASCEMYIEPPMGEPSWLWTEQLQAGQRADRPN